MHNGRMRVLGVVFVGTATGSRAEMSAFVEDVLGLPRVEVAGVEADLFSLPGDARFAVSSPGGMGDTGRTIGFLVDDLDGALQELRAAGIEVDGQVGENAEHRYAHVRAPDGRLYELIERRPAAPG
jgi:catechol 2,3-dioxygenase-like lactoylglutathione lyase family enzyme